VLLDEELPELDKFIEEIKKYKGTITLVGHTDTRGSYAYNDKLSLRRANAVRDYMKERMDLSKYEVVIKGMGERKPLYFPEHNSYERAQNRRTEISFKGYEEVYEYE
jgi:outer membrane protein OmpA-like peptidoglycan-associated protein